MNGLVDHFCKCPEHLVMALVVVEAAGQDSDGTLFQHKEGRKAFLLPISKVSSTAWTRNLMQGRSTVLLSHSFYSHVHFLLEEMPSLALPICLLGK